MKLIEITRPDTIDQASDILHHNGYQEIGVGTWATVFHKPGAPFILKLYKDADFAFTHYLNLIMTVKNQHFPRIKGRPLKVTNTYSAVQMEYLTPMSPKMEKMFQNVDWDNPENVPGELGKALQLIHQYVFQNSGVVPDLNITNVMARGNTMVIIDPAEPW